MLLPPSVKLEIKLNEGAGAAQLLTLVTLTADPGLVRSTYVAARKHL